MPRFIFTDRGAGPVTHSVMRQTLGRAKYGSMVPVHTGEIIFECEAENIEAADRLLLSATGKIAARESAICCEIKP